MAAAAVSVTELEGLSELARVAYWAAVWADSSAPGEGAASDWAAVRELDWAAAAASAAVATAEATGAGWAQA